MKRTYVYGALVVVALVAAASASLARDAAQAAGQAREAAAESAQTLNTARQEAGAKIAGHVHDGPIVDHSHASVLGRIKESIDAAATAVGIKHGEHGAVEDATLGERVRRFVTLPAFRERDAGDTGEPSAPVTEEEMEDSLLKAAHARRKTLTDRVADGLEAVGVKEKPDVKAAAKQAAQHLEGVPPEVLHAQLSEEPTNAVQKLLHLLRLREKSEIEEAADAYQHALHDMRVELGVEEPLLLDRLNTVTADAVSRLQEVTAAAGHWMREAATGKPAFQGEKHESFLDSARSAWDSESARALSALMNARDTAAEYTQAALHKTALVPEKRGSLEAANKKLDASMHRVLVSLGYAEPTFLERMRDYLPSGASRRDYLADKWDGMLKAMHVRDKSALDKSREAYQQALHRIKVVARVEDPTAAEKLSTLMDHVYDRIVDATEPLHNLLPIHGAAPKEGTTHELFQKAIDSVRTNMNAIDRDVDSVLKQIGFRDKTMAEALRDNMTEAWQSLQVSLGITEPTLRHRLEHPGAAASGMWDSMLKTVGLREKTAIEQARDRYFDALHGVRVALGAEDPTWTEQAAAALDSAREGTTEAVQYMLSYVPGSAKHVGEEAREAYDDLSARTISGLLHAREEVDRLLKRSGLKQRTKLEEARSRMDDALHQLWIQLGYEQPSLLHRLQDRWHRAAQYLTKGAEPSKVTDRLPSRETFDVAVDAAGEVAMSSAEKAQEVMHGGPRGIFSTLRDKVLGG